MPVKEQKGINVQIKMCKFIPCVSYGAQEREIIIINK